MKIVKQRLIKSHIFNGQHNDISPVVTQSGNFVKTPSLKLVSKCKFEEILDEEDRRKEAKLKEPISLVINGVWQVAKELRPKGWEKMGVREP